MKIREIARAVGCSFTGDGDKQIHRLHSAEKAGPDDLTFIMDRKHRKYLETSQAGAFVLPEEFPDIDRPTIRSANAYLTFAQAQRLFYQQPLPAGPFVHPTAVVASSAQTGKDCYIGAHAVIGDEVRLGDRVRILPNVTIYPGAVIGDDSLIHSHAVIREYCQLGKNTIIQNGAIIGADGFGFAKDADGSYFKILQAGRTILADDVEIQSNTCVDRGTLDDTVIGRGSKLDNLVQVAHGCEIGENCVLVGQVGLAGSTKVGNNVMMAGQVGVAGHCVIGDNVIITAQSGVVGSVDQGKVISGSPAVDQRVFLRMAAVLYRLPEMMQRIRELESEIEALKKRHE